MLSVTGWMELEPVDKSTSGMDCLRCALTLRPWWDKSTCKQTVEPDGTLQLDGSARGLGVMGRRVC